jgi:hypothetical protein
MGRTIERQTGPDKFAEQGWVAARKRHAVGIHNERVGAAGQAEIGVRGDVQQDQIVINARQMYVSAELSCHDASSAEGGRRR